MAFLVTSVGLISIAVGWYLQQELDLSAAAPLLAGIVTPLTVLACEPVRRRTPEHDRMGPANVVTLFRAIWVSAVACFIGTSVTDSIAWWASGLAAVALALDGLDGFIARRTGSETDYGAQLDMELDSIMMLVLSVLAFMWGRAGLWVLFCGLARYAWIAAYMCIAWFRRPLLESFRRKTACVIGGVGLLLSLVPWAIPTLNTVFAATATATLIFSFGIDLRWLISQRKRPISC